MAGAAGELTAVEWQGMSIADDGMSARDDCRLAQEIRMDSKEVEPSSDRVTGDLTTA
jgi:hypothetical protein